MSKENKKKYIITQAHSNDEYYFPVYCLIPITKNLIDKLKEGESFCNLYNGAGDAQLKFYGWIFDFGNNEESKLVKTWLKNKEDKIIELTDEQVEELTEELNSEVPLDTYMIVVEKGTFYCKCYGKYNTGMEFFSDEIAFTFLKNKKLW